MRPLPHSVLLTARARRVAFVLCLAGCGGAETAKPAPRTGEGAFQILVDAGTTASSSSLSDDALDASATPVALPVPDASSADKPCGYASTPSACAALRRAMVADGNPAGRSSLLETNPSRMFNRGAAATSLHAVDVSKCAVPSGPLGAGYVRITFATSGKVSSVEADAFPFAGTGVGACIANKFRSVQIPAFEGGAVTVGTSFRLR